MHYNLESNEARTAAMYSNNESVIHQHQRNDESVLHHRRNDESLIQYRAAHHPQYHQQPDITRLSTPHLPVHLHRPMQYAQTPDYALRFDYNNHNNINNNNINNISSNASRYVDGGATFNRTFDPQSSASPYIMTPPASPYIHYVQPPIYPQFTESFSKTLTHFHHRDSGPPVPAPPVVESHSCPIPGCNKSFRKLYSLRSHSNCHSNERSHACKCGSAFQRKHDLKRHQRKCKIAARETESQQPTTSPSIEADDSPAVIPDSATVSGSENFSC